MTWPGASYSRAVSLSSQVGGEWHQLGGEVGRRESWAPGTRENTLHSTLAPPNSPSLEGSNSLPDWAALCQGLCCQRGAESPPKVLGVSTCLNTCFLLILSFLGTSEAPQEKRQAW